MTAKSSNFRFVTYTDRSSPAEQFRRDLKAVRSHVMHDYFSRQRPTEDQDSSLSNDGDLSGNLASPGPRLLTKEPAGPVSASHTVKSGSGDGDDSRKNTTVPLTFQIGCFQLDLPSNDRQNSVDRSKGSDVSLESSPTPQTKFSEPKDPSGSVRVKCDPADAAASAASLINSSSTSHHASTINQANFKPPISDVFGPQLQPDALNSTYPYLHFVPGPGRQLGRVGRDPSKPLPTNGRNVEELISWHFDWPTDSYNAWEKESPCLSASIDLYKRNIWDMVHSNKGLFHMFLCQVDAKRATFTGQCDKVEYLYNRGEAIREIMDWVQEPKAESTTSIITLITNMAGLALGDDGDHSATAHMNAAAGLVKNHSNGLYTFSEAEWRTVIWNDLRVASATFEAPKLPYSPRYQWASPPELLDEESHRLAGVSSILMPHYGFGDLAETVHRIFQKLHQTCLIYDVEDRPTPSLIASYMHSLYYVEYELCTILSRKLFPNGSGSEISTFTPAIAMLLTTQVFAWICMPSQVHFKIDMPPNHNVVEVRILKVLLQGLREQTGGDLVSFWRKDSRLESLVWVLIVAHRTYNRNMPKASEKECWILEELEKVGDALGYKSKDEFAETFRCFPCAVRVGVAPWPGLGEDFARWNPKLKQG